MRRGPVAPGRACRGTDADRRSPRSSRRHGGDAGWMRASQRRRLLRRRSRGGSIPCWRRCWRGWRRAGRGAGALPASARPPGACRAARTAHALAPRRAMCFWPAALAGGTVAAPPPVQWRPAIWPRFCWMTPFGPAASSGDGRGRMVGTARRALGAVADRGIRQSFCHNTNSCIIRYVCHMTLSFG